MTAPALSAAPSRIALALAAGGNCGTGAEGFTTGNTCAAGGGAGSDPRMAAAHAYAADVNGRITASRAEAVAAAKRYARDVNAKFAELRAGKPNEPPDGADADAWDRELEAHADAAVAHGFAGLPPAMAEHADTSMGDAAGLMGGERESGASLRDMVDAYRQTAAEAAPGQAFAAVPPEHREFIGRHEGRIVTAVERAGKVNPAKVFARDDYGRKYRPEPTNLSMTAAAPSRAALMLSATADDDWGDATDEEADGYDPDVCELPAGVVAELSAARPASRILLSLAAGGGDCDWKTIQGQHVCLNGEGHVVKGPAHLMNHKFDAAGKYAGHKYSDVHRAVAAAPHTEAVHVVASDDSRHMLQSLRVGRVTPDGNEIVLADGGTLPVSRVRRIEAGGKTLYENPRLKSLPSWVQQAKAKGTQYSAAAPASRILLSLNCGTGAGGFQSGNTCGKGRYGRSEGVRTSRTTLGNIRKAGAVKTKEFTDSAGRRVEEHTTPDGRTFHAVTHASGRRSFHQIDGPAKANPRGGVVKPPDSPLLAKAYENAGIKPGMPLDEAMNKLFGKPAPAVTEPTAAPAPAAFARYRTPEGHDVRVGASGRIVAGDAKAVGLMGKRPQDVGAVPEAEYFAKQAAAKAATPAVISNPGLPGIHVTPEMRRAAMASASRTPSREAAAKAGARFGGKTPDKPSPAAAGEAYRNAVAAAGARDAARKAAAGSAKSVQVGDRVTLPQYTGAPGGGKNYGDVRDAEVTHVTDKFVTVKVPNDPDLAAMFGSHSQVKIPRSHLESAGIVKRKLSASAAAPASRVALALACARPATFVLSLSAAESPPAAAIDPPPGMPDVRDGVPVYYRRKRIGGARKFTHMGTGETVDTPRERLSAWAAAFNKRNAKNLHPFVYPRHLEAGEQPDATKTLGYVIGVDDEPDGLYARLQMFGEEGRKAAAVNGASVTITAGPDWDGEQYPEFLHHLALTPMAAHPDAAYVPTLAASGAVVMAPVYVCGPGGCRCPASRVELALSAGGGCSKWRDIEGEPVCLDGSDNPSRLPKGFKSIAGHASAAASVGKQGGETAATAAPQKSAADVFQSVPKGAAGDQFRVVVDAINKVHAYPDRIAPIPVEQSNARGRNGTYIFSRDTGRATKMLVSKYSDHPLLTGAHEAGHFLDHQGLGDRLGEWGSLNHPDLADWRKAAANSEAFKSLGALAENPPAGQYVDKKYVEYNQRTTEVFARSYAQYVAEKSGNPQMLAELDASRRSGDREKPAGNNVYYPVQWSASDFAPIRAALDKFFANQGLAR